MPDERTKGLVDTNILILRRWIDPNDLPDEIAISAITLAELSAGVHQAGMEGAATAEERASRVDILARAENDFDPVQFDAETARRFGVLSAAVVAYGRTPRRRIADLMIAATASVSGLPLYTTNPDDYAGLGHWVDIRAVPRPTSATC